MALTPRQRKALKALAHSLNPVIQIGKEGFDARVQKSLHKALNDHELLKVQLINGDDWDKKQAAAEIAEAVHAEVVQVIGFKIVLYRRNEQKKDSITLPQD